MWLGIGALIEAIVGTRRGWLFFSLFIVGILVDKIMIVDAALNTGEIAGAAVVDLLQLPAVGGRQPGDFAGASLEFGINVVPHNGAFVPCKPRWR
ncbi:MAG: hypothetical protein WB611_08165 [Stellaceae bacterium]